MPGVWLTERPSFQRGRPPVLGAASSRPCWRGSRQSPPGSRRKPYRRRFLLRCVYGKGRRLLAREFRCGGRCRPLEKARSKTIDAYIRRVPMEKLRFL
jgi:hypothetical protein